MRHFPFASIGPPSSDLQTPSLVWQEPSLDVAAQLEVPHHILDILAIDEGRFWVKHILVGGQSSGREKTQWLKRCAASLKAKVNLFCLLLQ